MKFTITNKDIHRITIVNIYLENSLKGAIVADNSVNPNQIERKPIINLGKKIIDTKAKRSYICDFTKENIELEPLSVTSFIFEFSPKRNVVTNIPWLLDVDWKNFKIVVLINSPSFDDQVVCTIDIVDE